jgi:hypothetical protein
MEPRNGLTLSILAIASIFTILAMAVGQETVGDITPQLNSHVNMSTSGNVTFDNSSSSLGNETSTEMEDIISEMLIEDLFNGGRSPDANGDCMLLLVVNSTINMGNTETSYVYLGGIPATNASSSLNP